MEGSLRRALPEPYNEQFRELIDVLHVGYLYDGRHPKGERSSISGVGGLKGSSITWSAMRGDLRELVGEGSWTFTASRP